MTVTLEEREVVDIRFPKSAFEEVMKESLPNFPEYAGVAECLWVDYDKHQYAFADDEGNEFTLTLEDFTKTFMKYVQECVNEDRDPLDRFTFLMEPCNIDASILDYLLELQLP